MEIVAFIHSFANVVLLLFIGIFVAAVGLFFFDPSLAHKKSVETRVNQRARRAAQERPESANASSGRSSLGSTRLAGTPR